jgi:AraC-like DNA-binding protein
MPEERFTSLQVGAPPVSGPGGPERILYAWPVVQVGTFDSGPDDACWRRQNRIGAGHLIAFPGTAVRIAQDGHEPVVADANRLIFYNRLQVYRRSLVSRRGDHCSFLILSPALVEELARGGVAPIHDPEDRPFPEPAASSEPAVYLEKRTLVRLLARKQPIDELELQERLLRLAARAVRAAYPSAPRPLPLPSAGRRGRADLVEAAREALAADPGSPLSLDAVARRVGVSVFHLAHVFRKQTGMGLHAYRDQLRVRGALPEVLDGSRRLADVALDAGYVSHSHFTDRFGVWFGTPPSRARAVALATGGDSKILEADRR